MSTSAEETSIQALSPALCALFAAASTAAIRAGRSGGVCARSAAGAASSENTPILMNLILGPDLERIVAPLSRARSGSSKIELFIGRIGDFYGPDPNAEHARRIEARISIASGPRPHRLNLR